MRTKIVRHSQRVSLAWSWRRVAKSVKVAEYYFTGAFMFLAMAATSESVLLIFAALALFAAAVRHYKKVEGNK